MGQLILQSTTTIAIAIVIAAAFLMQLCMTFLASVSASSYLVPAFAIVCTAVTLGPAHSAEIAEALYIEYKVVGEDAEQATDSTSPVEPITRPIRTSGVINKQHQPFSNNANDVNFALFLPLKDAVLSSITLPVHAWLLSSVLITSPLLH